MLPLLPVLPMLALLTAPAHPASERRLVVRVAQGLPITPELTRMAEIARRAGTVVEVGPEGAPVPDGAEAVYVSGLPVSPFLRRSLARFPISVESSGFRFDGRVYHGRDDAILLREPGERAPRLLVGTSAAAILRVLRGLWRGSGGPDFLVVSGELMREGRWRRAGTSLVVEPRSGRDEIAERDGFLRSLETVEAEGARWHFRPAERGAFERWRRVLRRLAHPDGAPLEIRLYPDAVRKGLYTGSSSPADVHRDRDRIGVDVDASAPPAPDLVSPVLAAAARAAKHPRLTDRPLLLLASGARDCGEWWDLSIPAFGALVSQARVSPSPREVLEADTQVSPLLAVGAAAWWLEAGARSEGEAAVRRALEAPDAELLSSLERWAARPHSNAVLPARRPLPAGFLRGISYAMSNSIEGSYVSPRSRETLQRLARLSVNSVSIMPFAFARDPHRPSLSFVHRHPSGETDEGTVRAVSDARAAGMTAMVKPQIWIPGSFVGQVAMSSDADWGRWFDLYRRFLVHHAVVAEAAGAALFCVGTELAGTEAQVARWRDTIAAVRLATGAPLVYAANWAAGAPRVPFWGALDAIGVDFYDSLSPDAAASDAVLAGGVRAAIRPLELLARRTGKPVVFCEAGYPPVEAAWISPHDESSQRASRREDAARAIAAVFRTLDGQAWWKGVYWWKAFSSGEPARAGDRDFNVLGTPAERAISEGFQRIARERGR